MTSAISIASGAPRKPTALKELEGTARPDRSNPNEPKVACTPLPPPPKGLDTVERAAWIRLAAAVDPMRISTAGDLDAFALMVQSIAICERAGNELRKHSSLTYESTDTGRLSPRPELQIIASHSKIAIYHLSRFGLTPADRSRVSELLPAKKTKPKAVEDDDSLEEFSE